MIKVYTEEMIEWLKNNVKGTRYKELTGMFNKKFGLNVTETALRTKARNIGLKNGLQGVGIKGSKILTKEQDEYLRSICKGSTWAIIKDKLNEKFGLNLTVNQINGYMTRYRIHTGTKGQFVKGQTSWNKGRKMPPEVYEKAKATMFKKGNIPQNYKPVGSKRITVDGYVEIKIKDPNKWVLEHRLVWEKAHGPIPKDCVVIHLDQNKSNNSLSNLRMVNRNITTTMHHIKGWSSDSEVTNLSLNIAELKRTINVNKRRRKANGND